jgi:hypothetical protein
LLILIALSACGAPGSDAVFTRENPKLASPESIKTAEVKQNQPVIAPKPHSGLYRRIGEESQFQICGTKEALDVTGTAMARYILHERFRWQSVWQGEKMYAILQGWVMVDSQTPKGREARAAGRTRTVFFMMDVDSVRAWQNGDCKGMKVP